MSAQEEQQHESQYQQEQSSDTGVEMEIKSKVAHSSAQLQKLSMDDNSFFAKIMEYNDISVGLIEQAKHKQALLYLQQAERMLQYGAMRGKTIDRNLILCVLNNQAVSYQKQWIIDKTAKYIQALIYNIQTSIEDDNIPFQTLYSFQGNNNIIKRKNLLVKYYLIYCALLSQLKQNQTALKNSFKALLLLKQMFAGYSKYYKSNAFRQKDQRMFTAKKLRLLSQLSKYNENLDINNYQTLFKRTQYILKEWRQGKSEIKPDDKIQLEIKDFSIAKVMQPGPLTYKDFNKKLDFSEQISMLGLVQKVLLFVINLFSIATQIRLIDSHRYNSPQQKMKSVEFRRSQLYHLTAIKSILIKHIQTSYANHYKHELNIQNATYIQDDQFLEISEHKSVIDSDRNRNFVTNSNDDDQQHDMIKSKNIVKKKKIVPTIEIPKSPKATDSKNKISSTKRKTPRKLLSPPLPTTKTTTTKRTKDPTTDASNTPRLNKVLSARKVGLQKQKFRDTSKSKKKSKISRQKSELKTTKKKSKSVNKQKPKDTTERSRNNSKKRL